MQGHVYPQATSKYIFWVIFLNKKRETALIPIVSLSIPFKEGNIGEIIVGKSIDFELTNQLFTFYHRCFFKVISEDFMTF